MSLGELRPIREPFLESRLGVRNAIIGVLQAPLVRVDTSGDGCLRVRAEPSLDGEVLTCLAHGAMLAMLTPRDPSAAWIEVAGPGGLNGWASAEFLVETTVRPPK